MTASEPHRARRDAMVRLFVVVALGAYIIAGTVPGLSMLWDQSDVSWGPHGALGFSTDYDGLVKAVDSDSPASFAGVAPGDRVDLARTPAASRAYIDAAPAAIAAGRHIGFYLREPGGERWIDLVAPHRGYPPVAQFSLLARTLAAFIFVSVGGLLVLLRPQRMTWGFYLYCLGFSPGIAFAALSRHPSAEAHAVYILITDVLTAAGTVGIFVFALEFMRNAPSRWRLAAEHLVPYLFVAFVGLVCYPDVANLLLGMAAERVQEVMLVAQGAMFGLSVLITMDTYIRARAEDRERIQWVVIGLIVGVVGTYAGSLLLFSSVLPFAPPHWVANLLLLLNITLPLTVAYAVIRHRVFDLSFVVSRAVIYAMLTFLLGSVFGLIGWFIGHELEATNLARIVEILTAIAFSFWLNSLQTKVTGFADGIFFRQRRAAMLRLQRAAEALMHAEKFETINAFLVDEPVAALELKSAALYARAEQGDYHLKESVGWQDAPQAMAHDDPLTLNLEAQQSALRPTEIGWRCDQAGDARYPALAVPLLVRRELVAFALYSGHTNGADIDPDEARSLQALATSAEACYDHLHAAALDEEVRQLRVQAAEADRLRTEISTLSHALDPQRGAGAPSGVQVLPARPV